MEGMEAIGVIVQDRWIVLMEGRRSGATDGQQHPQRQPQDSLGKRLQLMKKALLTPVVLRREGRPWTIDIGITHRDPGGAGDEGDQPWCIETFQGFNLHGREGAGAPVGAPAEPLG